MLQANNNLYPLDEQDIVVQQLKPAIDLAVITSLHGGASQDACAYSVTKSQCNSHPQCQWSAGGCVDKGTGDWD
jgi:hypothetical protein